MTAQPRFCAALGLEAWGGFVTALFFFFCKDSLATCERGVQVSIAAERDQSLQMNFAAKSVENLIGAKTMRKGLTG